ncbi:MAG: LysM peptidoglycan-binding domain-containing protein [Porticoccaceae bacterium]
MLFKTKNNIFYLCLLLISLRLVGCASVTEDTQGQTKEAKEQAPIVDLNAPTVIPEAVSKLEPENDPESEELQTEGEKQTIPPVAQQEAPEPVPPIDAWQRLRKGFEITPDKLPYSANKQLQRYLNNPHNLNLLFEHSAPFLFHVTEQLENANLPLELALLPIVESNYDPLAYSPSHAVGLWQFIASTATSLGLERSRWYEGRRDVVHSTAAAATYLAYLNKQFNGNWLHALAAYNSGEGVVRKAIRKNRRLGKSTEFWSLRLPRETKNYVPQLMALAYIVKDAEKLEVKLPEIANKAYFSVVELPAQIELDKIIEVTGVDDAIFTKLNSAYKRSVTPPESGYHVLLPVEKSQLLSDFLATSDPATWAEYREYIVKSGDTLSHIAKRYQQTTAQIKITNRLRNDFLRVGQVLRIPPMGEVAVLTEYKTPATRTYIVSAGDTLSEIAAKHKVTISSLKRANNLSSNLIKVGQELVIKAPASGPKTTPVRKLNYQVRSGDSLYLIAKRFDLKITDITAWNKLDKNKYLQPGQRLTLYINPLRI